MQDKISVAGQNTEVKFEMSTTLTQIIIAKLDRLKNAIY